MSETANDKTKSNKTTILLIVGGLVLLIGMALFGTLIGDPAPPEGDLVHDRIAAMTDCDQLQRQFDIAADNNERATPGTSQHRRTLEYMTAADDRMEELGCYD